MSDDRVEEIRKLRTLFHDAVGTESGIEKWYKDSIDYLLRKIAELESKVAEYHDAYEGKKHKIYEVESKIQEIRKLIEEKDKALLPFARDADKNHYPYIHFTNENTLDAKKALELKENL